MDREHARIYSVERKSRKQNIRLYICKFNMKYENVGSVDGITVVYRVSHISNGLW